MNKMMLQKSLFSRQLVLMNNCVAPQSKLLTNMMIRSFYYPDANHHHLNQEVSSFHLLINNLAADCVGKAHHKVCGRPSEARGPGEVGRRAGDLQDELEL